MKRNIELAELSCAAGHCCCGVEVSLYHCTAPRPPAPARLSSAALASTQHSEWAERPQPGVARSRHCGAAATVLLWHWLYLYRAIAPVGRLLNHFWLSCVPDLDSESFME